MANIYKGVGVHWGVGSTAQAITNGKLQTRDHDIKSEMETVKDADGITIHKCYYDPNQGATFEAVITGSSGGAVVPVLPAVGDVCAITDAVYTQISGSSTGTNTWLVEDVSTRSSNTSVMRVTIRLQRYSGLSVA